jgi:hypothetical protein
MKPQQTTIGDLIADLATYPNDMIITQFYIKIKTKIGNAISIEYNQSSPLHRGRGGKLKLIIK